jgi:hypothetical protein
MYISRGVKSEEVSVDFNLALKSAKTMVSGKVESRVMVTQVFSIGETLFGVIPSDPSLTGSRLTSWVESSTPLTLTVT